MLFRPAPLPFSRAAVALLAALLWIGAAAVAAAATPDEASPANASGIEQWKGRFCTSTSCRNASASPIGAAASFGAAILAIRWMARRPATRPAASDSPASSPPAANSD